MPEPLFPLWSLVQCYFLSGHEFLCWFVGCVPVICGQAWLQMFWPGKWFLFLVVLLLCSLNNMHRSLKKIVGRTKQLKVGIEHGGNQIKVKFNIIAVIGRNSFLKVTQEKSQGGWNPPAARSEEPLPVLWLTCVSYSSSLQWSLAKVMESSLLIRTEQLKMTETGNKERF